MHGKIRIFLILIFLIVCVAGHVVSGKIEIYSDTVTSGGTNEFVFIRQTGHDEKERQCFAVPVKIADKKVMDMDAGKNLSKADIELIALVTMAEAEGEHEYGKRLVIDTVLNRVDSVHYPNTVSEVIYQSGQFSSMWNGRVDRCYVEDEICRLVEEELLERKNCEVIYFTAGGYGKYGIPMFQEGNHYFSSYE